MQREKKPNTWLNAFCFLLPFPITFFLPAGISILVTIILDQFIYDPYDHTIAVAIPVTYILFVILELILAIIFMKIASSPRSKAAAQSLLIGTRTIAIIFVLFLIMFLTL